MSNFQNENLAETVKQKIKLFTKESYFKYFNYILIEKSKNISAFQKISSLSFSIEKLYKEKSKKNKLKIKGKENSAHSIWYIIMLLICDNSNHNKKYYKRNEFNLNPICYSYLTNICQKKIKLLISFSINHRLTLGTLVKYYIDLCINQMNQKETNDNLQTNNILTRPSAILDYRKFNKKANQKVILKESNNNNKNIDNNNEIDNNKKSNQKKKLEYCNSFTRLFIGEIDANSVKERYLSNMVIKKRKELHLYNSYTDLSNMYLKRLYNKLFKKENKKVIDRDMIQVLNQFKNDTKKVENYQRNILILEKFEKNRENNNSEYDELKEFLKNELKAQKKIYMEHGNDNEKNNKEKNNNSNQFKRRKYFPRFLSLSSSPKMNNFYKINSHIFLKNNDNINNDNKSQFLSSFNLSSNNNNTKRIRCTSASVKKSRNDLKKDIASKIGKLCSTINIKEKNQNHTNNNISQKEKLSNLLKDKNNYKKNQMHIKRSNSILIKMKIELKENNDIIRKRKHYKLKNFLNKNDFFYTKMS